MSILLDDKLMKNMSIEEEKLLFKEWMKDYRKNLVCFNDFFNNFCMYLPLNIGNILNRPDMITLGLDVKNSEIIGTDNKFGSYYINQARREFYDTIDSVLKNNNVFDYLLELKNPLQNLDKIMKATFKSYFDLRRMGYNRYKDLIA